MTTANSKTQAAQPSPLGGLPASPELRGQKLERLMAEWARARYDLTIAYAQAYVAQAGADGIRTQAAKLAAAEEQLALDYARAAVDGYKAMLNGVTMLGVPDADA